MRMHWLSLGTASLVCAVTIWGCGPSEAPEEPAAPEEAATLESPAETAPATAPAEAEQLDNGRGQEAPPAETAGDYEVGESALLEGLAPQGWKLSTPVEHYEVETLYNKINGRSEMYMSYNVRELSWAGYVKPDEPGRFIDIFVYDMQSATGAFGVYAAERDADQEKVDLGRDGYTTDGNYYFWKGKYYAYVQSSHDDEAGRKAAFHVASNLDARLQDNDEEIRGLNWLPTEGLQEDSITYFLVDAMSLDFMTDTFTARYDLGLEFEPVCFVTRRESPAAAEALFEEYKGYLEDYGMSTEDLSQGDIQIMIGDLGGGYYDGGFVVRSTVGGISAVQGEENAKMALIEFASLIANQ